LRVRVAPVVVQDVIHTIKALGSIEAQDLVQVTAQVEGVASDVRFREGDRVSPTTVLLRIDPDRHRVEAERAKALKDQAAADLGRAQADLQRRESLAASQLLSTEELTRSRGENARLAAAVEVAKAAYELALQDHRRAEVRPPITGVINTRTVDTGQFVRTGTVLATIVDVSRLRLRFKVSEGESLRAREGGRVSFGVAPLGPREFGARIYHVGRVADPATRQVEVLAWVDPENELKPGFFAEVTLAGEKKEGALVVPESAIQASERGFVAYVVQEDKARLRPVGLGLRTGTGVVEILSGLAAGEVVVSEGSDRLADGIAVEPVTAAAGAAPATAGASPAPAAR
jgi:multidrug efflux system membrane fusion protein